MRHYYWRGCSPMRLAYAHYRAHNDGCSKKHRGSSEAYETRSHARGRAGGSSFGVRRPLRYLRYHLDLDETQTRKVAVILNALKLEREQAEVDEKRILHSLADILTRDDTSAAHYETALEGRVKSAERMKSEVARALNEMNQLLDPDQREEFAQLVRSGQISL